MAEEVKKLKLDNFELRSQLEKLTRLNVLLKQQYTAVRKELDEAKTENCRLVAVENNKKIEAEKARGLFVKTCRDEDPKVLQDNLKKATSEKEEIQNKYEETVKETEKLTETLCKLKAENVQNKIELEKGREKIRDLEKLFASEREMCNDLHSELILAKEKGKQENAKNNIPSDIVDKNPEIIDSLKSQLESANSQLRETKSTASKLISSLNARLGQQRKEIDKMTEIHNNEKEILENKMSLMEGEMTGFEGDRENFMTFINSMKMCSQFPGAKGSSLANELELLATHIHNQFSSMQKFCNLMDSTFSAAAKLKSQPAMVTTPNSHAVLQPQRLSLVAEEPATKTRTNDATGDHVNEVSSVPSSSLPQHPQQSSSISEPIPGRSEVVGKATRNKIVRSSRHAEDFARMVIGIHGTKLFCKCDAMFTSQSKLRAHIQHFQREDKFQCPECPQRFAFMCHLKRHVNEKHATTARSTDGDVTFIKQEIVGIKRTVSDVAATSTANHQAGHSRMTPSSLQVAASCKPARTGEFMETEAVVVEMGDGHDGNGSSTFRILSSGGMLFRISQLHGIDNSRPGCCVCGMMFPNREELLKHIEITTGK